MIRSAFAAISFARATACDSGPRTVAQGVSSLAFAAWGAGGGGGSAYVGPSAASPELVAASGQIPAATTMPGHGEAGLGNGGIWSDGGVALSGAAGLVVVAYPK